MRDLQPNPTEGYLQARNYQGTLDGVAASGPWDPVSDAAPTGPIKLLDFVSKTSGFVDLDQCSFLNYSINYYLQ